MTILKERYFNCYPTFKELKREMIQGQESDQAVSRHISRIRTKVVDFWHCKVFSHQFQGHFQAENYNLWFNGPLSYYIPLYFWMTLAYLRLLSE